MPELSQGNSNTILSLLTHRPSLPQDQPSLLFPPPPKSAPFPLHLRHLLVISPGNWGPPYYKQWRWLGPVGSEVPGQSQGHIPKPLTELHQQFSVHSGQGLGHGTGSCPVAPFLWGFLFGVGGGLVLAGPLPRLIAIGLCFERVVGDLGPVGRTGLSQFLPGI